MKEYKFKTLLTKWINDEKIITKDEVIIPFIKNEEYWVKIGLKENGKIPITYYPTHMLYKHT